MTYISCCFTFTGRIFFMKTHFLIWEDINCYVNISSQDSVGLFLAIYVITYDISHLSIWSQYNPVESVQPSEALVSGCYKRNVLSPVITIA